jgi:hypothetical protein
LLLGQGHAEHYNPGFNALRVFGSGGRACGLAYEGNLAVRTPRLPCLG